MLKYCTFRPLGGLPEEVDLLDGRRRPIRVWPTDGHQQPLKAFQNLLRELVLLWCTSIQLL